MITPHIEFGTQTQQTESSRLNGRHRQPDSVIVAYQSPDPDAYPKGAELAEYPGLPVVERERIQDGPVYQFRLRLEGIDGPRVFIETDYEESLPEVGPDEIRRVVYTKKPHHAWFVKGSRLVSELTGKVLAGFERMWVAERMLRKADAEGYYEVMMTLKGLLGDKPGKRQIDGTSISSVSVIPGAAVLSATVYAGFPPVADGTITHTGADEEIEYLAASLRVTDTYVMTEEPPTDKVGQPWEPPDPPDVVILSLSGEATKQYWPFGWICTAMPVEKIAGISVWIVSPTWAYQRSTMPTLAAA